MASLKQPAIYVHALHVTYYSGTKSCDVGVLINMCKNYCYMYAQLDMRCRNKTYCLRICEGFFPSRLVHLHLPYHIHLNTYSPPPIAASRRDRGPFSTPLLCTSVFRSIGHPFIQKETYTAYRTCDPYQQYQAKRVRQQFND